MTTPVEWLERHYDKSRRMRRLGADPAERLFGIKDDHHDDCTCEQTDDPKLGATAATWIPLAGDRG
jgi:hypothetical protein